MTACQNPLCDSEVPRRGAKWCSDACRKATRRRLQADGYDPAEWERRSQRFWSGMAALERRAVPSGHGRGKRGQSPDAA